MAARKRAAASKAAALPAARRRDALTRGRDTARTAMRNYDVLIRQLSRRGVAIAAARRRPRVVAAGPAPLLFAEGDSWFDYPFCDVLTVLRHTYGYDVEKVAHAGHTVESMAYDPDQLAGVVEHYRDLKAAGREPAAVLLSGGGNDIAGSAIESLLNHRNDPSAGFNESVMLGIFDQRIHAAMVAEIGALSEVHRQHFGREPRVLIHGYDYAVPDNRGYFSGLGPLPGPWLAPQFHRRGYQSLTETLPLMHTLIDRFNAMAKLVAASIPNAMYVDLRGTLSDDLANKRYEKDWANELHPTSSGFLAVADKFDRALRPLLSGPIPAKRPRRKRTGSRRVARPRRAPRRRR
jgi:hypothetical protein